MEGVVDTAVGECCLGASGDGEKISDEGLHVEDSREAGVVFCAWVQFAVDVFSMAEGQRQWLLCQVAKG